MNFGSVRPHIILALLFILQASVDASSVDASDIVCIKSCPIVHPQQHFCNADAAFKAKIISSVFIDDDEEIVNGLWSTYVRYEVQVQSSLKGYYSTGARAYVYSPSGFTCSIPTMPTGEVYLIAGKIRDGWLTVTDCDGLAIQWDDLTDDQRSGVKGRYQQQCHSCQIKSAGTLLAVPGYWSTEDCLYNPYASIKYGAEDCETLYSYCTPPAGGSTTTTSTCSWKETPEYRECYQQREDARFFTEEGRPAYTAYTCRSQCNSIRDRNEKYQCAKATKKLERKGHAPC